MEGEEKRLQVVGREGCAEENDGDVEEWGGEGEGQDEGEEGWLWSCKSNTLLAIDREGAACLPQPWPRYPARASRLSSSALV